MVAGYRDLHQIHDTQPLGDPDPAQTSDTTARRRATEALATAVRLAHEPAPRAPISTPAITERSLHR